MKTLLVAVDDSGIANKVVGLAVDHALAHQAEVVVLCCIEGSAATFGPLEIEAGEEPGDFGLAQDAQNTAEAVVRRALATLHSSGVSARGRVVAGESAETIVSQASALNAMMIIMGRRHLSPFNRLLKGSCSASVVERASCPVLIDVRAD